MHVRPYIKRLKRHRNLNIVILVALCSILNHKEHEKKLRHQRQVVVASKQHQRHESDMKQQQSALHFHNGQFVKITLQASWSFTNKLDSNLSKNSYDSTGEDCLSGTDTNFVLQSLNKRSSCYSQLQHLRRRRGNLNRMTGMSKGSNIC